MNLKTLRIGLKLTKPGAIDEFLRVNGAGEMLVFSAADFEDFPEPRPDLPKEMESDLKAVVTLLAKNKWPFRLHATYGESIERFLNVFEEVNDETAHQQVSVGSSTMLRQYQITTLNA